MNLLFRCFNCQNVNNLVKGYKTYVRPLLEYCTQVWSPYRIKDIKAIEGVQRRFTKRLRGLENLTYSDRLKETSLETLTARRTKHDLILTYKIIFGLTCLKSDEFYKLNSTQTHITRGHMYKLALAPARTDVMKNSFICRTICAWNSLPEATDFSSLNAFKNSTNTLDLNILHNSLCDIGYLFV